MRCNSEHLLSLMFRLAARFAGRGRPTPHAPTHSTHLTPGFVPYPHTLIPNCVIYPKGQGGDLYLDLYPILIP